MISLNGPHLGTLEVKELIKHTARTCRERKQYKKAHSIKTKRPRDTDSKQTQVTLSVEPKFMENDEEYLDAITPQKIHHFKF